MNFDEFFQEVEERGIKLVPARVPAKEGMLLSNEALFHLPLLAAIILIMSKLRIKPVISEVGQLVGESLERAFGSFKGSSQRVGWSANLRMRTVRALTFLESANLVTIDRKNNRITASELGKKVIDSALTSDSDLAYTLRLVERKYMDIQAEKKIEMELT